MDKAVQQLQVTDLTGAGHVDSGTVTGVDHIADGNMIFVHIGHRQILPDILVDLFLQLGQVYLGGIIREGQHKTVTNIVVTAAGIILRRQQHFAQILRGVGF